MPVNFMIYEGKSSVRGGDLSSGGRRFVSPSTFLKLLCLDWPCLLMTGMYDCHHALVYLKTLSCCLEYTHPVECASSRQVLGLIEEDSSRVRGRF